MKEKMPAHIAIIMDGNGRWARKRGLPRTAGHKQGAQTIRSIAIACNERGVKVLSVYAFSTENWKRPQDEVDYLCKLPRFFFNRYMEELIKNNIQVRFLGEIERFPEDTRNVILSAVEKTKHNSGLILCLAVNYGGRREITLAAQRYAAAVLKGEADLQIEEEAFSRYLMSSELPDVDLMIRTSGEQRLSNFLLWSNAYAEFIFTPVAWPDFDEKQLDLAIQEYQERDRRYGGIS
ncbi:MAG: isoprenyl transferase [Erysipelotrichaceae bacterium]|nr:isoprenyl transferase [Erysipelotrichaceae bacterium]MCI9313116.1 isoprenyl transferase [Erysipelotrichaceae bacterium]